MFNIIVSVVRYISCSAHPTFFFFYQVYWWQKTRSAKLSERKLAAKLFIAFVVSHSHILLINIFYIACKFLVKHIPFFFSTKFIGGKNKECAKLSERKLAAKLFIAFVVSHSHTLLTIIFYLACKFLVKHIQIIYFFLRSLLVAKKRSMLN